jgi:hypothetical protein
MNPDSKSMYDGLVEFIAECHAAYQSIEKRTSIYDPEPKAKKTPEESPLTKATESFNTFKCRVKAVTIMDTEDKSRPSKHEIRVFLHEIRTNCDIPFDTKRDWIKELLDIFVDQRSAMEQSIKCYNFSDDSETPSYRLRPDYLDVERQVVYWTERHAALVKEKTACDGALTKRQAQLKAREEAYTKVYDALKRGFLARIREDFPEYRSDSDESSSDESSSDDESTRPQAKKPKRVVSTNPVRGVPAVMMDHGTPTGDKKNEHVYYDPIQPPVAANTPPVKPVPPPAPQTAEPAEPAEPIVQEQPKVYYTPPAPSAQAKPFERTVEPVAPAVYDPLPPKVFYDAPAPAAAPVVTQKPRLYDDAPMETAPEIQKPQLKPTKPQTKTTGGSLFKF